MGMCLTLILILIDAFREPEMGFARKRLFNLYRDFCADLQDDTVAAKFQIRFRLMILNSKFFFPFVFCTLLLLPFLYTACNTFEPDYERDNPLDPILPKIKILSPNSGLITHHADSITIKIEVSDQNGPVEDMEISLYSRTDGLLTSLQANSSGIASTTISGLSIRTHWLKAEVINSLGKSMADSVRIFNNAPPASNITSVELVDLLYTHIEWEPSTDNDFRNYVLHRINSKGEHTQLAMIEDIHTSSFTYESYLDSLSTYYVETYSTFYSNFNTGAPGYLRRDLVPNTHRKISHYPGQPLMVINHLNRLTVFNYEEQRIVGEIPAAPSTLWSTMGDNGFGLEIYFVEESNRSILHIYDAHTLQLKETIPAGYNIIGLVSDNRGNIITREGQQYRVSKRGEFPIHKNIGHARGANFKVSKTSNDIYGYTLGISPSHLWHMSYTNTGVLSQNTQWPYHGGISFIAHFRLHPQGEFIISSSIGTIIEKAPSLEFRKHLNQTGGYSDFAFSENGDYIFAADNRGWINIYHDLSLVDRIDVNNMRPRFINYDNGNLILFAGSTVLPESYGLIVFPDVLQN